MVHVQHVSTIVLFAVVGFLNTSVQYLGVNNARHWEFSRKLYISEQQATSDEFINMATA